MLSHIVWEGTNAGTANAACFGPAYYAESYVLGVPIVFHPCVSLRVDYSVVTQGRLSFDSPVTLTCSNNVGMRTKFQMVVRNAQSW